MINKPLLFLIILALPWAGYGQAPMFRPDSLPVVDGKIVFHVDFESAVSAEEAHERTSYYLNNVMNPYRGEIHASSNNHLVCRITDYVGINASIFQTVGMYMSYSLSVQYTENTCTMMIWDLSYQEKQHYEAQEASARKLNVPEYSGEDIMLGNAYKLMLVKNASERITEASIARINGIVKDLEGLFSSTPHVVGQTN